LFALKFFSLTLAFTLSTGQLPVSAAEIESLKRPVALNRLNGTSADAVASLLVQAQAPGGIISIYSGCRQPDQHVFSLNGGTLRVGLDYISGVDESGRWTSSDGVIVVGFQQTNGTLLNVVLADAAIEPNDALSLATQKLLRSVEMRDQMKKTGLVELTPPLGFSAVRKRDTEPLNATQKPQPERLYGKTLLQILNYLALSRGRAVWHYEQFVCEKKSSFRVSWSGG